MCHVADEPLLVKEIPIQSDNLTEEVAAGRHSLQTLGRVGPHRIEPFEVRRRIEMRVLEPRNDERRAGEIRLRTGCGTGEFTDQIW